MSSILKVDTIQDQAGNNIINENSNTITIGASGDTINIIGTLQNNGGALPGDISSVVAGTGLSGGGTSGAVTINIEAAQPTITSLGTITSFRSTGIDDNSNALAMTINSSEQVGIGTASPSSLLHLDTNTGDANSPFINFDNNDGNIGQIRMSSSGDFGFRANTGGTGNMFFQTGGGSERIRIPSGGGLLVGKTSSNIATGGFEISSGGDFSATKSGSTIAQFNRLTNDGDVVRIKKDGTTKHVFTTTSLGVGVSSTATTLTVGSTASGNQGVTGKTALFSGTHTTVYNAGNNGTFGGITIVNGDSTSNRTAAGVNFVNGNSGVSSIVGTSDTASRGDLRFITRGADNSGNTSERMRIADNGSVLIGTSTSGSAVAGDLVVNGGVFLGGTAAANELDDYEEGTWTPAYRGASSAGSYSSNANGTYTKIGNKVFVTAHIKNITQNSAGSGSIQIAGLPFAKTNSQESDIGSIYLNLFSLGSSHEYAIVNVNPGLSTVLITAIDSDGGAASTLQLSARQSDSADMFFSVTYTT